MKRERGVSVVVSVLAFLVFGLLGGVPYAADAEALTMYGVIRDTSDPNQYVNYLVRIDPATGDATGVRRITGPGTGFLTGFTADPVTGELYAVGDAITNPVLITIDRSTGEATYIGDIDVWANGELDMDFCVAEGLDFHPVSGVLYGAGDIHCAPYSQKLVTIDPATGKATFINRIAQRVVNKQDDGDSLGFVNNTLYSTDSPYTGLYDADYIEPGAGYFYWIGSVTNEAGEIYYGAGGLAGDHAAGVLYAVAYSERALLTVSTSNGDATVVGYTNDETEFNGGTPLELAFAPDAPVMVNAVMPYPAGACLDQGGKGDPGAIELVMFGGNGFDVRDIDIDEDILKQMIATTTSGNIRIEASYQPYSAFYGDPDFDGNEDGIEDLFLYFTNNDNAKIGDGTVEVSGGKLYDGADVVSTMDVCVRQQ